MLNVILASTSPHRKMLLERLKIPFECVAPNIDETPHDNESPEILVKRLAREKAEIVAKSFPQAVIIGADQVGILDGAILCKPITKENAIKQLEMVSGKKVIYFVGLCILNTKTKETKIEMETYEVFFRTLSLSMINHYLEKEKKALQCAGSLRIDGLGITLVEKLSGTDYTTLIGLPLIRLSQMFEAMKMDFV